MKTVFVACKGWIKDQRPCSNGATVFHRTIIHGNHGREIVYFARCKKHLSVFATLDRFESQAVTKQEYLVGTVHES